MDNKLEPTENIEINPNTDEDLKTLENLNKAIIVQPSTAVQQAQITSPGDKLEEAFSTYVLDAFTASKKEDEFSTFLKETIKDQIAKGEMSSNQIMTIFLNHETTVNDRLSRLIQPFAQLSIAKKQAEIQAQTMQLTAGVNINSGNYDDANKSASKEVLQGLSTFNSLIGSLMHKAETRIINPADKSDKSE